MAENTFADCKTLEELRESPLAKQLQNTRCVGQYKEIALDFGERLDQLLQEKNNDSSRTN